MRKSKLMFCCISVVVFISLTAANASAGFFTLSQKIEMSKKLEKDFNEQYKIIKNKGPGVTVEEINNNAAAGDKLKDIGIEYQKIKKDIESQQITIPTKEEILSEINLGISVIGQSIDDGENFIKNNPNDSSIESLIIAKETNLKRLEKLKQLKNDLISDKIGNDDAWKKVLEIRRNKK